MLLKVVLHEVEFVTDVVTVETEVSRTTLTSVLVVVIVTVPEEMVVVVVYLLLVREPIR